MKLFNVMTVVVITLIIFFFDRRLLAIPLFEEVFTEDDKVDFTFESNKYDIWSSWSDCRSNCMKSRVRTCVDKTCSIKTIRELMSCKDNRNCQDDDRARASHNTLASLPQNCGRKPETKDIKSKVYGGSAAAPNSWPWMLSLGYSRNSNDGQTCGATLLSSRWAITAAHCVMHFSNNKSKLKEFGRSLNGIGFVVINSYHRNQVDKNQFVAYISRVFLHPKFRHGSDYTDYDMALLMLTKDVNTEPYHGYACLPDNNDYRLPDYTECYALGWGKQRSDANSENDIYKAYDERLQEVNIRLLPFNLCKWYYANIYINYTIHVCAGAEKKDTCTGDSGGGLFCKDPVTNKWMIYGVVSFGSDAGCGEGYGVYAKPTADIEWIDKTIRQNQHL